MTVNVKQNRIMLTNSGMGKNQNMSLKCFSILVFKSRQKIHSSLKDDERLNMGQLKYIRRIILPITLM